MWRRLGRWPLFFSIENLYFAELFVGDAKDADGSFWRHHTLNSSYVNLCIFDRSAVPHINGKLKTTKPISEQILAKLRVPLPFNFRFCRQVKETQDPHNSILAKPFHPVPLDRAASLWFPCSIWPEKPLLLQPHSLTDFVGHQQNNQEQEFVKAWLLFL